MIIKIIERDKDNNPTLYQSSAVYTIQNGQRVCVNAQGFIAPTLEEVVSLVQKAECDFDFIAVR